MNEREHEEPICEQPPDQSEGEKCEPMADDGREAAQTSGEIKRSEKTTDGSEVQTEGRRGGLDMDARSALQKTEQNQSLPPEGGMSTPSSGMEVTSSGETPPQSKEESSVAEIVELGAKSVESGAHFAGRPGLAVPLEHAAQAISQTTGKVCESIQSSRAPDAAARAVTAGQDALSSVASKGGMEIAESTAKMVGGVAAGVEELHAAKERGVSNPAAVASGLAAGAGELAVGEPIAATVTLVAKATEYLVPEAKQVTKLVQDVLPANVLKGISGGTIATIDAAAHGDTSQLIRQADQNLAGDYGEPIRGYAMVFEAVIGTLMGDTQVLDRISNDAAGGKLGLPAELGDAIGAKLYDALHGD